MRFVGGAVVCDVAGRGGVVTGRVLGCVIAPTSALLVSGGLLSGSAPVPVVDGGPETGAAVISAGGGPPASFTRAPSRTTRPARTPMVTLSTTAETRIAVLRCIGVTPVTSDRNSTRSAEGRHDRAGSGSPTRTPGALGLPALRGRMTAVTTEIRANTVLPARREPIILHTDDGLSLVGELALPVEVDPIATLICLHPLPTHGGMMDSHLYRKAAFRLPALAGFAVLRFNTRGTASVQGRSAGAFDEGVGERLDVEAAVNLTVARGLPDRWLVGWSFGTELALKYGARLDITGAVLISPPLKRADDTDLDAWAASGKRLAALVPEYDDYLRPDEARDRFARAPQCQVLDFPGAKHLFVGSAEAVLDALVAEIAPTAAPLPRTWDGPSETATVTLVAG